MFARLIIASLIFAASVMPAHAQSQDTDVRAQASRVGGEHLVETFSGMTHNGAYNFSSEGRASGFYIEKHFADGSVEYSEDGKTYKGDWAIFRDTLCYSYDEAGMPGGCFRVYKVGTCFYFYGATIIERRDELDRDYWIARSVQDGDEATCEADFS